ncbi:MAG: InlB B-repeat-containing protein [Anaerovoracaceae bacterium]|jgi:uncharacterized repeat protein (TIGR02543 family)
MTKKYTAAFRKFLLLFIGVLALTAFLFLFSGEAHAATVLTQTSGELSSGEYELSATITATGTYTIPAGAEVSVDLKDHDINNWGNYLTFEVKGKLIIKESVNETASSGSVKGGSSNSAIVVEDGGTLELQSGAVGKAGSQGVVVQSGGTFTMTGGSVNGNTRSNYATGSGKGGAGVYIAAGGSFSMEGGEITNNHCTNPNSSFGGGVLNLGTFNMSGGSIYSNEAGYGGGVCNQRTNSDRSTGVFNMTGGIITQNRASNGGGIFNDGTFTLDGGTISLNYGKDLTTNGAYNKGAGVFNKKDFTMKSGKIIRNYGVDQGGGVWHGGVTFNLQGGTISGNTAKKAGGGIYYCDAELTISGDPVVKDNVVMPDSSTEQANDLEMLVTSLTSKLFTLGTLTSGAEVGVMKAGDAEVIPISKEVTDTSILEPSAEYFFSNRDEYIVAADQDQKCLVLRKPKTFTVTFDSNGGSAVSSQSVTERQKASEPADPTKSGATFEGWYTDSGLTDKYDFDREVTGDLTLYAKWKQNDSTDGGTTIVYPQNPEPGATVTITPQPKDGYEAEEVTVTDDKGNAITVTKNADGTYSFVQPVGNVTIYVNYVKKVTPGVSKKVRILNLKALPAGKNAEKLSWTKIRGAAGYDVYFGKCGRVLRKIGSTKSLKKRIRGLTKGTVYKYRVRAYKIVDGEKVYLCRSKVSHAVAGGYNSKFTDAKSIRAAKQSLTLKAGRTASLKAKQTKLKSGRSFLKNSHTTLLRFKSDNPSVASVSTSGKVRAKKAGTCRIYIYAINGLWTFTDITVK